MAPAGLGKIAVDNQLLPHHVFQTKHMEVIEGTITNWLELLVTTASMNAQVPPAKLSLDVAGCMREARRGPLTLRLNFLDGHVHVWR